MSQLRDAIDASITAWGVKTPWETSEHPLQDLAEILEITLAPLVTPEAWVAPRGPLTDAIEHAASIDHNEVAVPPPTPEQIGLAPRGVRQARDRNKPPVGHIVAGDLSDYPDRPPTGYQAPVLPPGDDPRAGHEIPSLYSVKAAPQAFWDRVDQFFADIARVLRGSKDKP
jgi:hypothetical protein